MKFVHLRDNSGKSIAVNPEDISTIAMGDMGAVIMLKNERRIVTRMFRTIAEAVKFCTTTTFDTSQVGEVKR